MPDAFPPLSRETFAGLKDRTYAEIARRVLAPFVEAWLDDAELQRMCESAYDFEVPLERVRDRHYLMRLDRGPTASFKDFAARMMARWFAAVMRDEPGELIVLTATSGDTGGAVAHAFHNAPRIRVMVLFPIAEVSDRQRRQMTTLGGNVTVLAVDGKFDDCQAMVKRAFADPALRHLRLTSANSINIGRLLPQMVYYVYAYVRLADVRGGESIIFSVPSGNFGDMMGAMLAWRRGLPVRRLIVATNANDEFPRFLETGRYEKVVPSRVALSNAMNVGHPSNIARLIHLYGGRMDPAGVIHEAPDIEAMRRDLCAVSISDDLTRQTIRKAHNEFGIMLEPHGAVGWAALQQYLAVHPEDGEALTVTLETAHPAKFPEVIVQELRFDPAPPPSLAGLDHLPESFETIPADYRAFLDELECLTP